MRRPWRKVLFHSQSFCRGMNATTLEKVCFHACFHNVRILWVYVLASGFGMLFYHEADIPITGSSRLVLSTPRFPFLLLYPTYVNGHVVQLTFYMLWFEFIFGLIFVKPV